MRPVLRGPTGRNSCCCGVVDEKRPKTRYPWGVREGWFLAVKLKLDQPKTLCAGRGLGGANTDVE